MNFRKNRVCPVGRSWSLDNRVRRWFYDPRRILGSTLKEGMTVLDFGCGPGFFTLDIARMVGPSGRVIAADLQAEMLEKLKGKIEGSGLGERITVHQCREDGIGLPGPIDFALVFYALHELPDQRSFLKEIRELLVSKGQMLVVEPPLHVSKAEFEAVLRTAQDAGFSVAERPRVFLSKAALLRRGP